MFMEYLFTLYFVNVYLNPTFVTNAYNKFNNR